MYIVHHIDPLPRFEIADWCLIRLADGFGTDDILTPGGDLRSTGRARNKLRMLLGENRKYRQIVNEH